MKNLHRPKGRANQEVRRRKRGRQRFFRSVGAYGLPLLLVSAVFLGSFAAATLGVRWLPGVLKGRAIFPLDQVRIAGNIHLTESQILQAADLKFGQNLLEIDLDALRARLMSHPLVRSAAVRRRLPSEVAVEIVERTPAAIVLDGARYVVDADGFVMAAPGEGATALPRLKGITVSGRRIDDSDREDLEDGLRIVAAIRSVGFPDLSSLECIDLGRKNDAVLVPRGGRPLVHVGRDNVADRLEKWESVVRDMAGKWREIEYVDLRAEGLVVAKPAPADEGEPDGADEG